MGQVGYPGDTENQAQADCQQRIETAQLDTIHKGLDE
jgi:hypothetical protein